tara:strand:+ start:363 stop:719 length:357 start_codon:yes stop_codon:yes gene_type:complete
MLSNLGTSTYNWRTFIPFRVYVARMSFEMNWIYCNIPFKNYFKRHLVWNGKQQFRKAVSSSGWRVIEKEECCAYPYSSDGEPMPHTWSNTKKNCWGQQYAICSECGVIKATEPTKKNV